MLNRNYLILITLLLQSSLFAQNWITRAGGGGMDESYDVEVDASGNYYSTGYLSTSTDFGGSIVVSSAGASDIYVAQSSNSGNFVWAKTFGGNFADRGYDIDVDDDGSSVITGFFTGTAQFDGVTLISTTNSQDLFVVKLDNTGNVVWAISDGGSGAETGYAVAFDHSGNVVVTGQFRGVTSIAGNTFVSEVDPNTGLETFDIFVAKYDSNGSPLWSHSGTSIYDNRGLAIDVDHDNNIVLTGQFTDTLTLAGVVYPNTIYNAGLICQLDSLGNVNWFRRLGAYQTMAYDVEVNAQGEIFTTGDFMGNMFIIDSTLTNYSISGNYTYHVFLLKFDVGGHVLWGNSFSSEDRVSSKAIALHQNGDIFITGTFKCNLTDFTDSLGTGLFNSVGFYDVFQARFLSDGSRDWVMQTGGQRDDYSSGIAVFNTNYPVVSGSFDEYLNFPVNAVSFGSGLSGNSFVQPNGFGSYYSCGQSYKFLKSNGGKDIYVGNTYHSLNQHYYYYDNFSLPSGTCSGWVEPCFNQLSTEQCLPDSVEACVMMNLTIYPNTVGAGISQDAQFYSTSQPYHPYNSNNGYAGYIHHIGPYWDYSYNLSNDSVDYIGVSATTNVFANVSRKDGCDSYSDTIHVTIHPQPNMPLLSDDHGFNNQDSVWSTIYACFPDTANFELAGIGLQDSISLISELGYAFLQDSTGAVFDTDDIDVFIVDSNGCENTKEIHIQMDHPVLDTIVPYLMLFDQVDFNDSIEICKGDKINVRVYDSLHTIVGDIYEYFYTDALYHQNWNIGVSNNCLNNECLSVDYYPLNSGWVPFEVNFTLGYDNYCGLDTTHYFISDSFYVHLNPLPPQPPIVLDGDQDFCPGDTVNVWADTVVQGGEWSGPFIGVNNAGDSLYVILPGTYSYEYVVVDSITGCNADYEEILYLNSKSPPNIYIDSGNNIICPFDSLLLTADPGIAYDWVGPDGMSIGNTQSIYVHDPGFYHCIITDADLCEMNSNSIELIEYSTPFLEVLPGNELCHYGSIDILAVHTGSPSFNWLNPSGITSNQITVTTAGTYICEVSQCGISTMDSVVITNSTIMPIITPLTDTVICQGDTAELTVTPSALMDYEWSNNVGFSTYAQITEPGTYTVTAYDYTGCSGTSAPVTIAFHPSSSTPVAVNDTVCLGMDAQLTTNAVYDVNWYDQNGQLLATTDTLSISSLTADTVFFVTQSDAFCESESVPVFGIVSTASLENQITSVDTVFCAGDTGVFVSDQFAVEYEWTLPDGVTINSSSSLLELSNMDTMMTGWLTLQLSDQFCSGEVDSIKISVHSLPDLFLPIEDTICQDDHLIVSILSGHGDSIYVDQVFQSTDSVNFYADTGSYQITSVNSVGCSVDSIYHLFGHDLQNPITISDDVLCGDSIYILNFPDSVFYEWNSQVNYGISDTLFLTNDSVNIPYWQIDSNGCETSLHAFNLLMTSDSAEAIFYGDSIVCEGDSVVLVGLGNADNYYWESSGGALLTGNSIVFTPSQGEFIWYYTETDGCWSDSVFLYPTVVEELLTPVVQISDSVYCFGDSITLEFNNFYDSLSYWLMPNQVNSYDSVMHLVVGANNIGDYYAITSNQGCVSMELQTVNVSGFPISPLSFYPDTIEVCEVDSISFNLFVDTNLQYQYEIDGTIYTDSLIELSAPISFIEDPIFIALTDTNGCSLTDSVQLVVYEQPLYDLVDTIICNGDTLQIDLNNDFEEYFWSDGTTISSNVFTDSGYYFLEVFNGPCYNFTDFSLATMDCTPQMANVFTPNNDGVNDVYRFVSGELKSMHLIIFNRWGAVVFESSKPYLQWDGTNNYGKPLADGVYYYVLEGETTELFLFEESGFIQLMR